MNPLSWAKFAALVSLAVLLSFGSYLIWTTAQTVKQVGQQTSSVLSQVSGTLTTLNSGAQVTFDNLNRPCGTTKPCGLFEDFARTTNSIRLASGQITALSLYEKPQLDAINQQELQLFSDTHKILNNLSDTISSANSAIVNIVPVENEIDTEAVLLQKSTRDFNTLILDPDITGTLKNLNTTTLEFSKTSTDFQNKFHSILYPPPCQGKFCFMIKAWPYIKATSDLAEPAYWFQQMVRQATP